MHAHLAGADLPPHYALGWLITWFTHTVPALDQAARLFDLFLATHPLMPLYFACMVIQVGSPSWAHPLPGRCAFC